MFRGFDDHLRNRVSRAGSHYLGDSTLRSFNAFGGRMYGNSSDRTVIVVESVERWDGECIYRPVVFRFDDNDTAVQIFTTDADAAFKTAHGARALALRAYLVRNSATDKELAELVRDSIEFTD